LYKQWDSFQGLALEGLEFSKLRISSKIVDRLGSKDITKLFPIQVTRNGGSSIFWSKVC
jgi:hypothetical protein